MIDTLIDRRRGEAAIEQEEDFGSRYGMLYLNVGSKYIIKGLAACTDG